MPTNPFPPAPPPAPLPDVRAALTKGLAVVAVGLAAAGVAWWATGPGAGTFSAPESAIAPYKLPLDVGAAADAEIAFYRKRIAKHPDGFMDQNLLAAAYLKKARESGDPTFFELAEQAAKQSLKLMPTDNRDAELVGVQLAIASHRFPEARREAERLAKATAPGSLDGVMTTISLAQGRAKEAAKLAEGLVRKVPSSANFATLGLARAASGDDPGAQEAFEQAIEREQAGEKLVSADARTWLGRLWLRRGRTREAIALFNEALRIHPRHGQALGLAGDAAARMGDFRAADERWRQAAELRHDIAPELARARIAMAQARSEDATALWAAAEAQVRAEVLAGRADHRRDLAALLLDRGLPKDLPEARKLLAAERTVRQDAETLDLTARAALLVGDLPAAKEAMAQQRAGGARDAVWLARAAEVARAAGDQVAASAAEAEADSLDPTWRKDLAILISTMETER